MHLEADDQTYDDLAWLNEQFPCVPDVEAFDRLIECWQNAKSPALSSALYELLLEVEAFREDAGAHIIERSTAVLDSASKAISAAVDAGDWQAGCATLSYAAAWELRRHFK